MSPFELYCVLKVDAIRSLLASGIVLGVFSVLGGGFVNLVRAIDGLESKTEESAKKWAKNLLRWGSIAFVLFGLLHTLIPTTKEYVALLTVPQVINNERVQALPEKFMELLDAKLKEILPAKDKATK